MYGMGVFEWVIGEWMVVKDERDLLVHGVGFFTVQHCCASLRIMTKMMKMMVMMNLSLSLCIDIRTGNEMT